MQNQWKKKKAQLKTAARPRTPRENVKAAPATTFQRKKQKRKKNKSLVQKKGRN